VHPSYTGARETPVDAKFDQGFNISSSDGETTRRLAGAVNDYVDVASKEAAARVHSIATGKSQSPLPVRY